MDDLPLVRNFVLVLVRVLAIDVEPNEDVNVEVITEEISRGIGATKFGSGTGPLRSLTALLLVWSFAVIIATTATATDFKNLAELGYRWVLVNGPYASPKKEDAEKLESAKNAASDIGLQDRTHAYFLLPGMIVLVLENDTGTGLSRIRASGIVVELWTPSKFLTSRPIKDSYGVTETPESTGLTDLTSPTPRPSPNAEMSPIPDVSPLGASPTPNASPSPKPRRHHP